MMTKREVLTILRMIESYYDQFVIDEEKVDNWHMVLKESTFGHCEQRVLHHAAISPYPPKICDFSIHTVGAGRAIPTSVETLGVIWQQERPASDEVVQLHLARIREILGIERGK
ncbi:hypothetical protein [Neobacillus sp. YIM B06451]|uniref:hypothetical protein n=1 Tax=Neobacillus sp. YIM B06451 TaxID=3070994 RepID=UPI0029305CE2|nr:hypothetical protein [Neobacillus sp. YIM B06451]